MSQPITKNRCIPGSLRPQRSARTLLLRMAADQERAQRIRQLKDEHPEIKWRMIAAHVGVTERAAQEWPKSGGIEPENAEKLAELFDVSYQWLWFGHEAETKNGDTPNPFAKVSSVDQVEDIREEFRGLVAGLDQKLDQITRERVDVKQQLAAQDKILKRIERSLAEQDAILRDLRAATEGLPQEAMRGWEDRIRQALRGDDPPPQRAAGEP